MFNQLLDLESTYENMTYLLGPKMKNKIKDY